MAKYFDISDTHVVEDGTKFAVDTHIIYWFFMLRIHLVITTKKRY